jgi:hypothetical protein
MWLRLRIALNPAGQNASFLVLAGGKGIRVPISIPVVPADGVRVSLLQTLNLPVIKRKISGGAALLHGPDTTVGRR